MNLYNDGVHKFILLKSMRLSGDYIWTNEYMIVEKNYAVLIDPGSIYSFFQVYDSILDYVDFDDIKIIFYSHHSVGNFSLYDRKSGVLFSKDIGASIVTNKEESIFVEDFDEHLPKMESFHKRYIQSNIVCIG